MKRIALIAALCFAVSVLPVAADETTEIYLMLYQQAEGLQQKYAAALSLVGLNDKAVAPVLASALEDLLLTQQSYSAPGDQELYGSSVRILCQSLGEYKYVAAASSLWSVVQQVPDPLAKSEAIMALGKMRALDYAERIALKLGDLNLQTVDDKDAAEKMAYGAIIALEKLKDPRGFSPVFFAADGWYSQRVRNQASQSLPNIAEDPTDPIGAIINTETPERQLRALQAEVASKADGSRKIETAVLALNKGHLKAPRNREEGKTLCDLRKLSLKMLIAYKAKGSSGVDGASQSYEKGFDDEERLLGLQALGSNGGDEAAAVLKAIVLKLNEDQKAGLSDDTRNRMAKAAIENCAVAKNKALAPALMAVSLNDKWSGGIILAAKTALKALQ
jgi:hypothetical protein